jgi:hypothetical protein
VSRTRARSIAAATREPECGKGIAAAPQSEKTPPARASALFAARSRCPDAAVQRGGAGAATTAR